LLKILADRVSEIESELGEEILDVRTFSGNKFSDISGEVIGRSAETW
jgi:hypothetical protein